MRSRKWKEKEFSTETLTQVEVDEIMAGSEEYQRGRAPVSRNTQYAESLEDMAELQKHRHDREELSRTHNYSGFDAVRGYNPDVERAPVPTPEYTADSEAEYCGEAAAEYHGENDSGYSGGADAEYFGEAEPEYYDGEDSDFYNELGDTQFALQPLSPDDENYEDIMGNYEDIMEKMSSNPTKPKYWFKEQGDHWFCSCGQLNKGDICSNCGLERDLLRALFFLHEPGSEPGRYDGMDIHYTDIDAEDRKLSSKAKLVIAIVIIAILLVAAGIFSYFYVIKPSMEKEAAANASAAAKSLETNVALFTSDMESFMRDSYLSAGDTCCKNEDFEEAIRFYLLAQDLKNSDNIRDKIYNAKYGYVCAHKSDGGEKFEKYLAELHEIGYSDIDKIYSEYYAWHFKIVANLNSADYTDDLSTVSRSDIVYFHVSTSGGPPDESIDVYYEATWPSGSKQTEQIGTDWKSGSQGTARFAYPVPILGKEGTLTFKLYDKDTQELLGSDSVTFKK